MQSVLHEAKAKAVGKSSGDGQQTGTCVLVSILLCQPPNWEQLAQRLFYTAKHDRPQLFYCLGFLNGAIWMELWLELSLTTRHGGVSARQKDTSWKQALKSGRSSLSNEQACGFTARIWWSGRGWATRGRRQQQASHFCQRLCWENKRLSSKNKITKRVHGVIIYGDNKSWWILLMTPLAVSLRAHHHLPSFHARLWTRRGQLGPLLAKWS